MVKQTTTHDGTGAAAMACGLAGLLVLFTPVAWFLTGILTFAGAVLGGMGMRQARRDATSGWGPSVTGLISGCVGLGMYSLCFTSLLHTEYSKFNIAAIQLNRMLSSTGYEDGDVLSACSAVQNAFAKLDTSRMSQEQNHDMEAVVNSAKLWANQLTLIKHNAVASARGVQNQKSAGTDFEIARQTFLGIRSSVEWYVNKYCR